jgi:hypothetical protein
MDLIGHKINYKNRKIEIDGKIYIARDEIKIVNGDIIRLTFESAKDKRPQAAVLIIDKFLKDIAKNEKTRGWCLWYSDSTKYIDFECHTKKGILEVTHSWMNERGFNEMCFGGSAMRIEDLPDGSRRYYCNDIDLDNDFDDLVFRIQFLNKSEKIESIF